MRARKGNADAKRKLVAPAYPSRYGYLLGWFYELHARRGAGARGAAPLTWPDLDAWARRTDRDPSAWEWRVIGLLDDASFATDDTPTAQTATPKVERAWPEAKP